ncbi:hypothetical protein GOBAR_AA36379 [Gossypium barbadense]|uniref:DUF8003 domain-containing protein n=1 Tax=Gossypium barbadense TaxID=3634 RepID=A0A2P5VZV6_GOSBA|nr:hypothetical protein GOBAR_AA36379 [Gossypium barbadense]
MHRYLCWCVLFGHLCTSVLCLSLNRSENLFQKPRLILTDESVIATSIHVKKSTSLPLNDSLSCEDLEGVGSFNTTCLLNSNLYLSSDLYICGTGNLEILPHVSIKCPTEGCMVTFNMSGNVNVGEYVAIVAGSVVICAANLTVGYNSTINTTSLAGPPPPQTSGTPVGTEGAGGGHGGRGASCLKNNKTSFWGGDVYAWSTLSEPWSYGSKGGSKNDSASDRHWYGGKGGGRVKFIVKDMIYLNGSVTAEGGNGGIKGGGGSGGSIYIRAVKLKGYGGYSLGCPGNSGAAGTYFNADLLSLRVGNDNVTTDTETPLLDFSTSPLWSNVFVENNAKVLVPLLWTRVQVRGQISLYRGGEIVFGLSAYPMSEFELVAEELLMSDSIIKPLLHNIVFWDHHSFKSCNTLDIYGFYFVKCQSSLSSMEVWAIFFIVSLTNFLSKIKVFGAFRVSVKMLLMWNSKIQIDGGGNTVVTASILEVRNLVVLRENSVISSNANLGVYGQGLLQLTGHGDAIKGQRLSLSLFYNITVGPGSLLQAPLDDDASRIVVTNSLCESQTCPIDLITPPDDCHVNYTLSFSLQVCRVEDLLVNGIIKGSIVHIHRARTVTIDANGLIAASELGCSKGIGKGNYLNGAGSGAGHGGRGGAGYFNGRVSSGGYQYGNADLPCELGSGTEGPSQSFGHVVGGGMIVIGSNQWPLLRLSIYGSLRADGQSFGEATINGNGSLVGGLGGGSGGTLTSSNMLSDSGGAGHKGGLFGDEGTVTGKKCPKGLYGTFCRECPIGTYKDIDGSDEDLCTPCPLELLPNRANFIYVRGGVRQSSCPYKCISEKYRMPNCYTPLEELMYTFGGPWPFALLLSGILVLLAVLLSTLRIKLVESSSYVANIEHQSSHHFPYLLSLSEVRGTRAEETQSHVYRMYFMGPNTFREPWHLPYSPPDSIIEIVYEDAFNRFIDEINSVAAYDWWEGSVHSILSVVAYPCAWSWKQWRRRKKVHRLQEYVKSEYDHSCLRSCRSRALYKGMKVILLAFHSSGVILFPGCHALSAKNPLVGATPDLMVAYIDFFLGGDEKRVDMVSIIQKRFPMCIIFGGDGSYMSPYNLHSDTLLTNLLGQHIPPTVWNRLVAGLNAQLRTVRHGSIRSALVPVLDWIASHGNPQLEFHGVKIELGWFQATASGYYQLGIVVVVGDLTFHNLHQPDLSDRSNDGYPRNDAASAGKNPKLLQQSWPYPSHALSRKKITGGINGGLINDATLRSLEFKRDFLFPFSLLLHNTRPVGRQDSLQLLITTMLLADLSVTLLTLLQFYWISLGIFLAVLLILPLSLLSPFPAGLNALFSKEPRRASLARIYSLWNATSLSNIAVAFICGIIHYGFSSFMPPDKENTWNTRSEDNKWWLLPTILLIFKSIQARFVDWHIANLEVQDFSLFCPDPDAFWAHEPTA